MAQPGLRRGALEGGRGGARKGVHIHRAQNHGQVTTPDLCGMKTIVEADDRTCVEGCKEQQTGKQMGATMIIHSQRTSCLLIHGLQRQRKCMKSHI